MPVNSKGANARKPTAMSTAIAAQIRAERSARNIAKDDMIARTGIGRSTYFDIERGDKPIDVSQLFLVVQVLGMSIGDFMARADARRLESERGENPGRAAGQA